MPSPIRGQKWRRWLSGLYWTGQDERRRAAVLRALRQVFHGNNEPLKFQACLPLMRDFQDSEAWLYVIEQVASSDTNRVRTAFN